MQILERLEGSAKVAAGIDAPLVAAEELAVRELDPRPL